MLNRRNFLKTSPIKISGVASPRPPKRQAIMSLGNPGVSVGL